MSHTHAKKNKRNSNLSINMTVRPSPSEIPSKNDKLSGVRQAFGTLSDSEVVSDRLSFVLNADSLLL